MKNIQVINKFMKQLKKEGFAGKFYIRSFYRESILQGDSKTVSFICENMLDQERVDFEVSSLNEQYSVIAEIMDFIKKEKLETLENYLCLTRVHNNRLIV